MPQSKNKVDDRAKTLCDFSQLPLVRRSEPLALEEAEFREAVALLHKLQLTKGLGYGRSWCKRGHFGIFFTIARKWDRLEKLILEGNLEGTPEEPIIETIGDLAVYAVKWVGFLRESYPEQYQVWKQKIEKDFDAAFLLGERRK